MYCTRLPLGCTRVGVVGWRYFKLNHASQAVCVCVPSLSFVKFILKLATNSEPCGDVRVSDSGY